MLAVGAALPLAAAPAEYRLAPSHSFVHFEIDHLGLSTLIGRLGPASGRVAIDTAARRGQAEVEVALAGVDTGRAEVDQALRAALGAAAGPATARFVATRLHFDGERVAAAEGTLSLGGRERPLLLQAAHFNCYFSPLFARRVCGGEFAGRVDLGDFALQLPPGLGLAPAVRLRVQVEAVQQEAP